MNLGDKQGIQYANSIKAKSPYYPEVLRQECPDGSLLYASKLRMEINGVWHVDYVIISSFISESCPEYAHSDRFHRMAYEMLFLSVRFDEVDTLQISEVDRLMMPYNTSLQKKLA